MDGIRIELKLDVKLWLQVWGQLKWRKISSSTNVMCKGMYVFIFSMILHNESARLIKYNNEVILVTDLVKKSMNGIFIFVLQLHEKANNRSETKNKTFVR